MKRDNCTAVLGTVLVRCALIRERVIGSKRNPVLPNISLRKQNLPLAAGAREGALGHRQ
jgi:hypothetical protein